MASERFSEAHEFEETGRTMLHVAVEEGNVAAVELLIKAGAKVNARDMQKIQPLLLAVLRNDAEIARMLLSNGASYAEPFDEQLSEDNWTMKHWCWYSHARFYWIVDRAGLPHGPPPYVELFTNREGTRMLVCPTGQLRKVRDEDRVDTDLETRTAPNQESDQFVDIPQLAYGEEGHDVEESNDLLVGVEFSTVFANVFRPKGDTVRFFRESVDPDQRCSWIIRLAPSRGNVAVIEALLSAGAQVKEFPLLQLTQGGHNEALEALRKHGMPSITLRDVRNKC